MFSLSLSVLCLILCPGPSSATPLVAVFLCLHPASFPLAPLATLPGFCPVRTPGSDLGQSALQQGGSTAVPFLLPPGQG